MIPQAGQRLRLLVRDARRARRLDHRLGSDPRVRGRQRRGRDLVGRLLQHAAPRVRPEHSRSGSRPATGRRSSAPIPAVHGLLQTAPQHRRHPDRRPTCRRSAIVMLDHLAAAAGRARERAREQHHGGDQAAGARRCSSRVGATHLDTARTTIPFAPNGFAGIHQGAAIVFFAYIGFDAISTAAEETKNPQRNLPIGILGGLAICTLIYVIVGVVLTGMVPVSSSSRSPIRWRVRCSSPGFRRVGWIVALGAVVSMSAVLLVFQYGQPRIFFAMAPRRAAAAVGGEASPEDRRSRTSRRSFTGHLRGAVVADRGRGRDLRSDEHRNARSRSCSSASACSCCATPNPERPRPFRVPFVWPVCHRLGGRLPVHHAGPAALGVGTLRHLARPRAAAVFPVRLPAQQAAAERRDLNTALQSTGEPTVAANQRRAQRSREGGYRSAVPHPVLN